MPKTHYISYFNMFSHKHLNLFTAGKLINFPKHNIGYIKKGSADFLYKGNTYTASMGDLIFIPKGTQYYSAWSGTPEIEFYEIQYEYTSDYAFKNYKFQIIKDFPPQIFDEIFENFKTDHFKALSCFYLMLSDIHSKLEKAESNIYQDILPAISYIENNYTLPITVDGLAKLCNMSKSALFQKFKNLTGVSPINYKHNIIVQHALDMLSNTDFSIEEISDKLGFSSPNYFRTVFIKATNKSPKKFKKLQNNIF